MFSFHGVLKRCVGAKNSHWRHSDVQPHERHLVCDGEYPGLDFANLVLPRLTSEPLRLDGPFVGEVRCQQEGGGEHAAMHKPQNETLLEQALKECFCLLEVDWTDASAGRFEHSMLRQCYKRKRDRRFIFVNQ